MSHALDLRPRSATEVIDASFQLMRRHYSLLLASAAILMVPPMLMEVLLPAPYSGFGSLLRVLSQIYAEAAVIYTASELYLGREPSAGDGASAVTRHPMRVFGAAFGR